MLTNILMGGLAGLVCALGGAIKDSPHEGFKPATFMRSPLVGLVAGACSIPFTSHPILAFVFAGYLERFAVEGWKILRCQVPGKHNWNRTEWPGLFASGSLNPIPPGLGSPTPPPPPPARRR